MKQNIITKLEEFRSRLQSLRKALNGSNTARVSKKETRQEADAIATMWVEELRSPLEHKFKLDPEVILQTAENMKRLYKLSRPNNQKSSYLEVLSQVLKKFDDKFILPIKRTNPPVRSRASLI